MDPIGGTRRSTLDAEQAASQQQQKYRDSMPVGTSGIDKPGHPAGLGNVEDQPRIRDQAPSE